MWRKKWVDLVTRQFISIYFSNLQNIMITQYYFLEECSQQCPKLAEWNHRRRVLFKNRWVCALFANTRKPFHVFLSVTANTPLCLADWNTGRLTINLVTFTTGYSIDLTDNGVSVSDDALTIIWFIFPPQCTSNTMKPARLFYARCNKEAIHWHYAFSNSCSLYYMVVNI